jgi:hypothetical protein
MEEKIRGGSQRTHGINGLVLFYLFFFLRCFGHAFTFQRPFDLQEFVGKEVVWLVRETGVGLCEGIFEVPDAVR